MKYYIFLLLFLLFVRLPAQPGFNTAFDMGGLAAAFGGIELSGDTVVLYGTAYESGAPAFGMLFARLDTFGNVMDHKIYNDSLEDDFTLVYPNSFIKLSDNSGYLGVGQLFQRRNGYIVKFDNTGSVIYFKELLDDSSEVDFFYQIIETENGSLVAGLKFRWIGEQELFVIRVDINGNKIWEKNYGDVIRNDLFGNIFQENSNEYIIGAGTTSLQGTPLTHVKNTSKIFAIDSLGNTKWQWESQPSLEELGVGKIFITPNNNWLYMSARGWYNATYNEISIQPKVIIRDENFNLIKEDTFDIANNPVTFFSNTIQLNEGGWLAVGSKPVNYATPPLSTDFNAVSGWIVKIDDQANKVWSRVDTAFWSTQTGSTNYLYDAVELPSGSIIACGYSRTYEPSGKDWGWLIKISSDGCVDTLSCATLQAPLHLLPDGDVRLYPNPATSWLQIESPDGVFWDKIELLNMGGQVLQTLYHAGEHRLDISGLPAGLYLVRLTKAQRSVTKKVVKSP